MNVKQYVACLLLGAISVIGAMAEQRFSTAGFYAVEGSPRTVENFNPGWRFHKGDSAGAEEASKLGIIKIEAGRQGILYIWQGYQLPSRKKFI